MPPHSNKRQAEGELRDAILRVCNNEVGGTAIQHSDGSVHVLHCPSWSARATALLACACPHAVISVRSSVSSLSGFIIVAEQRTPAPPPRFGACCPLGLHLLLCIGLCIVFSTMTIVDFQDAVVQLERWTGSFSAEILSNHSIDVTTCSSCHTEPTKGNDDDGDADVGHRSNHDGGGDDDDERKNRNRKPTTDAVASAAETGDNIATVKSRQHLKNESFMHGIWSNLVQ
jgi:hypothetical protein